jgi:bifunctional DNA-binding transcriptional regulator/antitoxin component of YhaV-PrlF toxin-antitoxin module
MQQTVLVSNLGQLTLPVGVRKRFGVQHGGVVILEENDSGFMIKAAAVLEVEMYSASQIAQWDADDQLDESERSNIIKRLAESR